MILNRSDIDELRAVRAIYVSRAEEFSKRLREVKAQEAGVVVTDHAVVRYLERTGRYDIASLRSAIAQGVDQELNGDMTRIEVEVGGLVFICDRGTVVTVLTRGQMGEVE